MDLKYPEWLDEMADRAIKHGLTLYVSCYEPTDYVLFDENKPRLTDEFGGKLIGDYAFFDGAELEQLLDELDDADDTDDGTADICTIAPLKQFPFDPAE